MNMIKKSKTFKKKYEDTIEKLETKFENIIDQLTDNINRIQNDYNDKIKEESKNIEEM